MQLHSSLFRGELPLDGSAPLVAIVSPGGHLAGELLLALDAPIDALHYKGGQIDLRNVQPGAMLGHVNKLDLPGQPPSGLWIEALVEGRSVVGVEVVADQPDALDLWVDLLDQFSDRLFELDFSASRSYPESSLTGQRRDGQKHVCRFLADILVILRNRICQVICAAPLVCSISHNE